MKKIVIVAFSAFVFACENSKEEESDVYFQKPKGFPNLELPEHSYQKLEGDYPYTFEFSKAAEIVPDNSPDAEPYWIYVKYPSLNAMIQFTYKPLNGNLNKLDLHVADAYKLASKHQIKAISQKRNVLNLANGRNAVTIDIEGEVPSHYQFYTTDTSKHFLRGAVYLSEATKNDSLKPLADYLKVDALKILETLKFKN